MSRTPSEDTLQNVEFPSNGTQASGYLCFPESGSGPGVIVIQEWWGLTTHIADITRRLAAEGFVALAPDLYGGSTTHDAQEAKRLMLELPADRAARDLNGAVDFLLAHPAVISSTVGAVGFCMGGGFVLTLAAQQGERVSAAAPFYGLPADPAVLASITAAVEGHYGEADASLPREKVDAAFAAITSAGAAGAQAHFYPAGHAFMNDENLIGTYDAEARATAWSRLVTFLSSNIV